MSAPQGLSVQGQAGTALITGLHGFTGRYMAAELRAHGWTVWGVGTQAVAEGGSHYVQADLQDSQALAKAVELIQPDVVVHLAAIAFVGHGDANAFYQVNLMGTRNLLEALHSCSKQPRSVLLASSANIYGNVSEGMLTETTSPKPANDYAVSKLAMEYMASLWQDKLPLVVVRPFNYTGVGQASNFLLPKIVDHFRRKADVIELGNLDVWRDFSDVRTVVVAYRRLLEVQAVGQTVNVCSGHAISLREVLKMARSITGHAIEVRVNPAFVRANEVKTLCGDPALLQHLVGNLQRPALEETLRWMLEAS